MRKLVIAISLLTAAFLLYIVGSGWIIARSASDLLTVSQSSRPTHPVLNPYAVGFRGDPQTAFGYPFEEVMIATELGLAPAWLVPAPGATDLAAVYVHGIAGIRENGYRHLSVLHDAGVPVLLVSYRNDTGSPLSAERQYSFGLTEWKDLDAAVAFLRQRGAKRIILVGESMGGAIVGQFLMRSSQADTVTALILDSPALDSRAIIRNLISQLGFPLPAVIEPVVHSILALQLPVDLTEARSIDAIANFPGPLFIAHGTGDRLVPASISDEVVTTRYGATTYVRTRATHLQSWHENPARYRHELGAFVGQLLRM
ncbi:alpha/beta fold hydrolase [Nordella sp. HKS 07]|uniref:alpha/beta hydrolase n=1 Tax=Nordella sp. HKS 07 TaxID=2712222 RepID=UPI0013E1B46F|nr:alpha/beta fold hydrolase [Nordella sp. HKS 07]QIG48891.1 alpha/beta fold hydrolase [Nordella sp. HKS 07]